MPLITLCRSSRCVTHHADSGVSLVYPLVGTSQPQSSTSAIIAPLSLAVSARSPMVMTVVPSLSATSHSSESVHSPPHCLLRWLLESFLFSRFLSRFPLSLSQSCGCGTLCLNVLCVLVACVNLCVFYLSFACFFCVFSCVFLLACVCVRVCPCVNACVHPTQCILHLTPL